MISSSAQTAVSPVEQMMMSVSSFKLQAQELVEKPLFETIARALSSGARNSSLGSSEYIQEKVQNTFKKKADPLELGSASSSAHSAADDPIGASVLSPSSAHYADDAPIEASAFTPSFADGSPPFASLGAPQISHFRF
ncbi:hypothetical protein Q3G72_013798 [Acer saccharum]|nr:hypothetical protein Q3G72_013798 [Acer saccharum]